MRAQFFGDSYDIIKRSFIAWLSLFGPWSAHPMFTEAVAAKDARRFARFLGANLLSVELLTPDTDRESYFSSCRRAGNLFLDPDTGVRLASCGGARSARYVFGPSSCRSSELVRGSSLSSSTRPSLGAPTATGSERSFSFSLLQA